MCNCKGNKSQPQAKIETPYQKIETTNHFDNIDEFFIPDTPDGLLARELKKWNEEEHKKLMELLKDEDNEYPLIHD
jgi:hypothetical protein